MRSRFWNRSFHIMPCEVVSASMQLSRIRRRHESEKNNEIDANNKSSSENRSSSRSICRLDRKRQQKCWRRCYWKSFMACIIIVLLHLTSIECLQARQEASSNCVFPQQWEGSWFQSGVPQTIDIQGSTISNRGTCIASENDKFLMREKRCHRCVVIYEKHKNVLQYKESECEENKDHFKASALSSRSTIIKSDQNRGAALAQSHSNMSHISTSDLSYFRSNDDSQRSYNKNCTGCRGRETLEKLCDQIPGDAMLYSMFKVDAEPIKCPIKGPFLFTYNRNHGECKYPVSTIESCTEDSRMLFGFQACPDVQGTESTVEELTCLATWKDGNARYLLGLMSHNHATSHEERFRCFVYERINSGKFGGSQKDAEYKLAQSGDATCNGLESAEVGSRTMTLRKAPPVVRCDFPSWFTNQKHWHTLSGSSAYTFHQNDGSMHIVKQNGYLETRVLCEQINKQTPNEMMAVVEKTSGCKAGFVCVIFYRRNAHVAELQMGIPASRLEDACAIDHFDTLRLPFITLLASNTDPEVCPLEGSYVMRGLMSPPYSSNSGSSPRHKRNHNSKLHSNHHHSHDLSSLDDGSSSSSSGNIETRITNNNFNAHTSLSFRNEEDSLKSWHLNDHNKSLRQRRSTEKKQSTEDDDEKNSIASATAFIEVPDDGSEVSDIDDDDDQVIKLVRNKRGASNSSGMMEIASDAGTDPTRSRRDTTINCGNVNTRRRQLNIGCSDGTKIDVSPQCDDGEEEFTCHGSWRENQTTFIIARHSKYLVCISFKQSTTDTAQLFIGDSCYREHQGPPIEGSNSDRDYNVANLTNVGHKCGEISGTTKASTSNGLLAALLIAMLITKVLANSISENR